MTIRSDTLDDLETLVKEHVAKERVRLKQERALFEMVMARSGQKVVDTHAWRVEAAANARVRGLVDLEG